METTEEQMISVQNLSMLLNLSPQRIQQLTYEGLPKFGRGQYPVVPCIHWYIDYLRKLANLDTKEGIQSKEKLLIIKTEKETIELKKLKGEVLETEQVCQSVMGIMNVLKSDFLGIPGRIVHLLQNKSVPEQKKLLSFEIRACLNLAADELENIGTEQNNGTTPK